MLNSQRELDLLEEYMRYWIRTKIRFFDQPTPLQIISAYKNHGVLINVTDVPYYKDILDFDSWKAREAVIKRVLMEKFVV